jgi:hypothetical protein
MLPLTVNKRFDPFGVLVCDCKDLRVCRGKQYNLPVKVRRTALSVHPANEEWVFQTATVLVKTVLWARFTAFTT